MMMTKFFSRAHTSMLCAAFLIISLCAAPQSDAATQKRNSKNDKKTASKKETAKKDDKKSRDKSSKERNDKAKSAREKRDEKQSGKNGKRERTAKRGDDDDDDKNSKSSKKLSKREKRERLAESKRERARKEAERRAEIARREAERREAIRRAEEARRARLAAIRAIDEGLRNETRANILRDDLTGEDLPIRSIAVKALGNHAGSVVVMNPETGQVYSIVNQEWGVRRGFKPCSTIKLVTGLAGVSNNVITEANMVQVGSTNYRLDLTDSLAYSNNPYFQNVGGRVGFDLMMQTAREMGLGQATGINHANESAGRIPAFKSGYAVNHMSSHGDDFAVTPIQLATMTAALVNGGNLLKPRLPRTPQEHANFKPETRRKLSFSKELMQRLYPGMIGAVNYGTGKRAFDTTQTVGGKTGSCLDNGTWVGLFTSVAPIQKPNLGVTVILKGSGERGKTAAGVAGEIIRNLNTRFGSKGATQLATNPSVVVPRPKFDAATAAAISDEEEDDAEAANLGLTAPASGESTTTGTSTANRVSSTPNTIQQNTSQTANQTANQNANQNATPNTNRNSQVFNPRVSPVQNTVRPVLRPIGRPMINNEPVARPEPKPSSPTSAPGTSAPGKFDKLERLRRATGNAPPQTNPQTTPQSQTNPQSPSQP